MINENMKSKWRETKKPMLIMLISLVILFGAIFIYKGIMSFLLNRYFASHKNPTFTVSTTTVKYDTWQPQLKSVGSLRAITGVSVTAQIGGMITHIYFKPGTLVQKDTVLVQQNADPDIAQLHALQANAKLALITYTRDKAQYDQAKAVSKQQVDSDLQTLKSDDAQVAQQAATVDKLTIKAPFTGYLGVNNVNPGQFLNPGDMVVTLQSLDPIYVDFYLPQQALSQLKLGQTVHVTTDAFPKDKFTGKITTINPIVDTNTRNVEVEATISNPAYKLFPGMFTNTSVDTNQVQKYLTVPQTAISFNPYGDIVYLVEDHGKDKKGNSNLTVKQVFVTTGETRGDQITILTGVKAGDTVVTSGQLKLKNGSRININNEVQPSDNPNPSVPNEHEG